jgi:uncharacterized protein YjbJ (UPF0337 family)
VEISIRGGLQAGQKRIEREHSHHSTSRKGNTMNKDQVKGRVEQVKGSVKEAAGKVVGNKELEAEGQIDKSSGKVQATYGDLKEDVKDALKKP